MVLTRNTSRSNANPPRMQDQPGNADSRPPDALETMQANTDEVEAPRLTNQRLTEELEQLTRQMRRPREARQTQESHDIPPHEGQHNIGTPRGAETEAESNRARGARTTSSPWRGRQRSDTWRARRERRIAPPTAPGAQQLTLTSSSTLHRSRYLRSQISLGYIATRPQRQEPSCSLQRARLPYTSHAASGVRPA